MILKLKTKIKPKIFQQVPYQMGSWYWPPNWEFKILQANKSLRTRIQISVFLTYKESAISNPDEVQTSQAILISLISRLYIKESNLPLSHIFSNESQTFTMKQLKFWRGDKEERREKKTGKEFVM